MFDLDGTLADTAIDLVRTLNVIMERQGAGQVPLAKARDVVGAGARAMIQRGLALSGRTVTTPELDVLFREFLVHYADNLAVETKLFDGAAAAIERFAAAGFRLAVCTNKVEEHSRRLLEALGIAARFQAICGRDTFAFVKPDPRHLTLTVERAGGDARRAVMIGDSRTDIDTAKAAGLPVIAVDFGYTDVPVRDLAPDVVVSHFDALWDAVVRMENRFA